METNRIGQDIRKARRSLGLSQSVFLRLYNHSVEPRHRITQATLSRYETGSVIPPADKYIRLLSLHLLHK